MNVTWPAPVSLLVLVVSAVIALLVLLDLLQILPYLGLARYFGGAVILVLILEVVGAALMAWGAWQEYQVVKPAMPNFGSTTGSTPPPPAATTPPPAATPPVDSTDEAPPV
jgi:hypothetical protein